MTDLPTFAPPYNPEAEPFWTGAAEGRLVLPRCDACGLYVWYPRSFCSACGAHDVTWAEVSGRGVVYARTILSKAMGPWSGSTPFVVAYVELHEGPRILTNVVTDDPASVHIGQPVRAVFVPVTDPTDDAEPQAILRFEPSGP